MAWNTVGMLAIAGGMAIGGLLNARKSGDHHEARRLHA